LDAAERHVFDAAPVALQVWEAVGDEPHTLTLRYANPAAEALPDGERWAATVHAACIAQAPETLELSAGEVGWRAQLTALGGRTVVATAWDISEHKLAERSLRASERLNREIVAGLLEGVLVVDTNARVVLANDAVARLFGVSVARASELSAIGVATFPGDGADAPALLAHADRAMYAAKPANRSVRQAGR
jgi:PAS domain-containing protein